MNTVIHCIVFEEVPLIPETFITHVEQLASSCSGDVQSLISATRAAYTQGTLSELELAQVLEQAGSLRASKNDRTGAWWAACAYASLRNSTKTLAQEDAEIVAARWLGEFEHSPAKKPLPEFAQWLVAGISEPATTLRTLELARRNASTYLERLEAELHARQPLLKLKLDVQAEPSRAEVESAIHSYEQAAFDTRAALSRVVDFLWARSEDSQLGERGLHVLEEFDRFVSEHLIACVLQTRAFLQLVPDTNEAPTLLKEAPLPETNVPPQEELPHEKQLQLDPTPTIEQLEQELNIAFEHAWREPTQPNREAFERAIKARYEREVASIEDLETRQKALEHYVQHAFAQLPPEP